VPLLRDLRHRLPGLRIGRTRAVLDALVPAILEQKVTGAEAHASLRRLVAGHGENAPGGFGLRLLPEAVTLSGLPPYAYHPLGIEERRAMTLRRVGSRAAWLERATELPAADAQARLRSISGVGSWTAAEVALRALGDPDAVSVGDFHLPHLVAWALAREPRATDQRMLELLEPFRGQRGRVIRWLEASGLTPPRFGPRQAPRWIAGA
jgi:3-methyladenine DNA glycosylase/8-oxoguanine DNA glycosylase